MNQSNDNSPVSCPPVCSEPDLGAAPISEQLRQEIMLVRAMRPLLSACFTLNHDLNNTLAGILGYCEILQEAGSSLSEEDRRHVGVIADCAERMRAVITNLSNQKLALGDQYDLRLLGEQLRQWELAARDAQRS